MPSRTRLAKVSGLRRHVYAVVTLELAAQGPVRVSSQKATTCMPLQHNYWSAAGRRDAMALMQSINELGHRHSTWLKGTKPFVHVFWHFLREEKKPFFVPAFSCRQEWHETIWFQYLPQWQSTYLSNTKFCYHHFWDLMVLHEGVSLLVPQLNQV